MQSDNLIFRLFGENFTKNAILKIMLALFTIFVMCMNPSLVLSLFSQKRKHALPFFVIRKRFFLKGGNIRLF